MKNKSDNLEKQFINYFNLCLTSRENNLSEDELCFLKNKAFNNINSVVSHENPLLKNREILKEVIFEFSALVVLFSEKIESPYPAVNKILSSNLYLNLPVLKDDVFALTTLYDVVKNKVPDFTESQIYEMILFLGKKKLFELMLLLDVHKFIKNSYGDCVVNNKGQIIESKNWVDIAVYSMCIFWDFYYGKDLDITRRLGYSLADTVEQLDSYSSWMDLIVESRELDLVNVWQFAWVEKFASKTVFD